MKTAINGTQNFYMDVVDPNLSQKFVLGMMSVKTTISVIRREWTKDLEDVEDVSYQNAFKIPRTHFLFFSSYEKGRFDENVLQRK